VADGWYEIVNGPDVEQGDLLNNCPIFFLENLPLPEDAPSEGETDGTVQVYDVVVLTQSCDLQRGQGRQKVRHVVVCPIQARSDIEKDGSHILHQKGLIKKATKNELPAFFVIPPYCTEDAGELTRELGVVAFQQVYTLPIEVISKVAERRSPRLRLVPPYREALSSRFASFFGRVALPSPVIVD